MFFLTDRPSVSTIDPFAVKYAHIHLMMINEDPTCQTPLTP